MVTVHAKGELEDQQFLYQCSSNSTIDGLIDSINEVFNLQARIQTLSLALRTQLLTLCFKENHPQVALALGRLLSEAETYASKDQVIHKRFLSAHILRDHMRTIEKEIDSAQSKNLINETTLQVLSDHKGHKDVQLWWAGKELERGKKLSDYIGENEKTKVIIRLKSASGQ